MLIKTKNGLRCVRKSDATRIHRVEAVNQRQLDALRAMLPKRPATMFHHHGISFALENVREIVLNIYEVRTSVTNGYTKTGEVRYNVNVVLEYVPPSAYMFDVGRETKRTHMLECKDLEEANALMFKIRLALGRVQTDYHNVEERIHLLSGFTRMKQNLYMPPDGLEVTPERVRRNA